MASQTEGDDKEVDFLTLVGSLSGPSMSTGGRRTSVIPVRQSSYRYLPVHVCEMLVSLIIIHLSVHDVATI